MNTFLKETSNAAALLSVSLVAEAASKMPDTEQVNNVMSMLTQLAVLVVAIWRAVKKPKPRNNE